MPVIKILVDLVYNVMRMGMKLAMMHIPNHAISGGGSWLGLTLSL